MINASVLLNALTDDGSAGRLARAELARDAHWAAPEHLLVETYSGIRGRYLGDHIPAVRAQVALAALAEATIELVSTRPLLPRMWQLRHTLSGYDAAYVAAAELLGCALITADGRLASVDVLRCEVRLIPAGDQ